MTVAIRVLWMVFALYQLLLAVGVFSLSLGSALVFWGAAVGALAFVVGRSAKGAYVSSALTAVGPFLVSGVAQESGGIVYVAVNILVAILMGWLAHHYQRRRQAESF